MAQLSTRRGFKALDEDHKALDGQDEPVQILDRQEQDEQVQLLVKLAQESLDLHLKLVQGLQACLLLILIYRYERPWFINLVSIALLVLALVRPYCFPFSTTSLEDRIYSAMTLTAITVVCNGLHWLASTVSREWSWPDFGLWIVAPIIVNSLSLVVEFMGKSAIDEAKGLKGLMYDSPEA